MSNDRTMAAPMTMARFIGLPPTLPEEIGTVVRPVTMRCHVRHRPLWRGGSRVGIYWRGWGAVMVAKCSNPSCSASFRHLEEGMLFRLESDPTLRSSNVKTPEYYWLCGSCSAAMTLHISKEGKVTPVALPAPVHGGPSGSDFLASMRQEGLLLSCVSFSTERHRRRARLAGRRRRDHAA